jgi:hypothetical protein
MTMANFEAQESINAVPSQQSGFGSLSDYAMVRSNVQFAQSDNRSNDSLVGNGMLPAFEIKDGSGQQAQLKAPRPLRGTDITTKEMKDSGVSAAQEKDGETKTTNARYPGGVEVSTSNGKTLKDPDGYEIKISNMTMVQVKPPLHETKPGSGVYVDEKGRAMVKVNGDGTVTVDTGKGFYTQGPDGVKKVSALRSRNGKDFEVLNTDDPLGNLRPPDMSKPRK